MVLPVPCMYKHADLSSPTSWSGFFLPTVRPLLLIGRLKKCHLQAQSQECYGVSNWQMVWIDNKGSVFWQLRCRLTECVCLDFLLTNFCVNSSDLLGRSECSLFTGEYLHSWLSGQTTRSLFTGVFKQLTLLWFFFLNLVEVKEPCKSAGMPHASALPAFKFTQNLNRQNGFVFVQSLLSIVMEKPVNNFLPLCLHKHTLLLDFSLHQLKLIIWESDVLVSLL